MTPEEMQHILSFWEAGTEECVSQLLLEKQPCPTLQTLSLVLILKTILSLCNKSRDTKEIQRNSISLNMPLVCFKSRFSFTVSYSVYSLLGIVLWMPWPSCPLSMWNHIWSIIYPSPLHGDQSITKAKCDIVSLQMKRIEQLLRL